MRLRSAALDQSCKTLRHIHSKGLAESRSGCLRTTSSIVTLWRSMCCSLQVPRELVPTDPWLPLSGRLFFFKKPFQVPRLSCNCGCPEHDSGWIEELLRSESCGTPWDIITIRALADSDACELLNPWMPNSV